LTPVFCGGSPPPSPFDPDPNLNCSSSVSGQEQEAVRLYTLERNRLFNSNSDLQMTVWIHNNQLYDVDWATGEMGTYFIFDSTDLDSNSPFIDNTISAQQEDCG